ncbi:MAG: winged helix-turn-helix transcriptional regulator [Candidatus Eiseniibacteriota bacterium]
MSTKSSPAKGIRDREPVQMEKCEIANIWQILGRRWTLLILKNLSTKEVIRFNELKRLLPGISSTVLAERLLDLDREGLISKQIYPEIPPRVEYRLTTRAKELETVLKDLNRWCLRWKSPEALRAR